MKKSKFVVGFLFEIMI